MENKSCFWKGLFDDNDRNALQDRMLVTGIFSVILSIWISVSILTTDLRNNWSYKNLANFYLISCLRRLIPPLWNNLTMLGTIENTIDDKIKCDIEGFLETFLSVFEVEFLTHICIERYVISKYVNNGWSLMKSHYTLYFCLSLFFSLLYSLPPLFGVGSYGSDFTCTSCNFEMILPKNLLNFVIITIFLLRSVKPAIFMIVMLKWASKLERKCSENDKIDSQFTTIIFAIVTIHFVFWSPIVYIKGFVIIMQLLNTNPMLYVSTDFISWGLWMHWVAPGMSVIALVAFVSSLVLQLLELKVERNKNKWDCVTFHLVNRLFD